jgi:hypothetical protein
VDTAECRFTLLDAMILIAGTAVSAAIARGFFTESRPYPFGRMAIEGIYILTASHLLLGWSVALLACQAWRRGRLGRRVARWPGTAACVAVFVVASLNLMYAWTVGLARTSYARVFVSMSLARPHTMAGAVAVAWSVLLLSGRWRPARAWPDRLGRAIGWSWLALYVVSLAKIAR